MSRDPWAIQRWALKAATEQELRPTPAHVLLVLAIHADGRTGEAMLKVESITQAIRRPGRQTVYDALEELVGAGLIARERRGPHRPAITRLLDPELRSGQPDVKRSGQPDLNGARGPASRTSRGPASRTLRSGQPDLPCRTAIERPEELPPQPPKGGRRRDRELYDEHFAAWADEHFPGIDVGYVRNAITTVEGRGQPLTPDNLRPEVERWATPLEETRP